MMIYRCFSCTFICIIFCLVKILLTFVDNKHRVITITLTNMKTIINNLLKENTGTHSLDSGGTDGRPWQKNQSIDFEKELPVTLEDNYFTVSLYHYLKEVLSVDSVTYSINTYLRENALHWIDETDLETIAETLDLPYLDNVGEIFNTYNWDAPFSQDFQGLTFTIDGGYYTLLQIHNGADIRGGYTDVQCFKIPNEYFWHVSVYGTINGVHVSTYPNGTILCDDDNYNEIGWDLETVEYDLHFQCYDL